MHLDIALTNKDSIIYWIDRATEQLQKIEIVTAIQKNCEN